MLWIRYSHLYPIVKGAVFVFMIHMTISMFISIYDSDSS